MNPKVSVFVATSLDGFIARKDGSLDWLDRANAQVPPGEDGGFKAFMASIDVLVMGRYTFDKVMSFGQWPYGKTPVIVLTTKPFTVEPALQKTVSLSKESPEDLCERLGREGVKHIYIDGGLTIQSFLRANLIDELTITLIPVVLGEGKSLFGPQEKDVVLKHIATNSFDFGFVQLSYQVIK
jgi:dihydrofolate reductase